MKACTFLPSPLHPAAPVLPPFCHEVWLGRRHRQLPAFSLGSEAPAQLLTHFGITLISSPFFLNPAPDFICPPTPTYLASAPATPPRQAREVSPAVLLSETQLRGSLSSFPFCQKQLTFFFWDFLKKERESR